MGRINRLRSDSLIADLGLLELNEIDIVVNAIISLEGMNHYLENLSSSATETRFHIPAKAWNDFQKINSTTLDALTCAIQALELSKEA